MRTISALFAATGIYLLWGFKLSDALTGSSALRLACGIFALYLAFRAWARYRQIQEGLHQWPTPKGRFYEEWMRISNDRPHTAYYKWLAEQKGWSEPWATWAKMDSGDEPPAQTFDLGTLRQDLAETQAKNPARNELETLLNRLDAKYGNDVPLFEMAGLQEYITSNLVGLEEQRHEIIGRGAKEGKTIEIESLRRTLERQKTAYTGPDPEAYVFAMERHLELLTAKYGTHIPIDHAYKIMQNLEAGRGYNPED
jgi:hypothetical protein